MIGFINFLKKRPSDKSLRIFRICFGAILIGAGFYNLVIQGDAIQDTIFWMELSSTGIMIVKSCMIAIGAIPLVMGLANLCVLKPKYIRILQIIFALLLFYFSGLMVDSPDLEIDTLYWIAGLFPLFGGITGKCITTKCMRFGEKITKIRV